MNRIRVIKLSGSPYDMGYAHGERFHDEIHHFTDERVRLCQSREWTGRELSREAVMALAEACAVEHQAYAPELMEELRGIADATKLTLAELVVNNGFTDFIDTIYSLGDIRERAATPTLVADNCTAFMAPPCRSATGDAFFGQTWDMHASATPYVILIRGEPDDAPAFLTFTVTGCVGMIGMTAKASASA